MGIHAARPLLCTEEDWKKFKKPLDGDKATITAERW